MNPGNEQTEVPRVGGVQRPLPEHVGDVAQRVGERHLPRERVRLEPPPDLRARYARRDAEIADVVAKGLNLVRDQLR
jgi:hypothetical protein